jgi:PAS domain S-box-containing protein
MTYQKIEGHRFLFLFSVITSIIVGLAGILNIAGWFTDIHIPGNSLNFTLGLKPSMAFGFFLAGTSFLLLIFSNRRLILIRIISALIILIGLLSMLENLTDRDLLIDNLFLFDFRGGTSIRMAFISAINLIFIGLSVLFLCSKWLKGYYFLVVMLVFTLTSSFVGLVGYFIGIDMLSDTFLFRNITLPPLILFLLISLGLMSFYRYNANMEIGIEQLVFTVFTFFSIVIVFVSFYSNNSIDTLRHANQKISHTIEVKESANKLFSHVLDLQTGTRGYLISSDEEYLKPSERAIIYIQLELKHLEYLVTDNPEQDERIKMLYNLTKRRISHSEKLVNLKKAGNDEEAVNLFLTGYEKMVTDSIRLILRNMDNEENELLKTRNKIEVGQEIKAKAVVYFNIVMQLTLLALIFYMILRLFWIRQRALSEVQMLNDTLDIKVKERTESLIKNEEEMKKLMNRLDLATSSAGIGIWDWDLKNNDLTWDDQMYRLYGQNERKKAAFDLWLTSIHPDDRERIDEDSRKAVSGEKDYSTDFRVVWSDGTIHWIKANGLVLRDESGKPARMIGVNYDFTERIKAEEEIIRSAKTYKYLFENNPQPMWIYDLVSLEFLEVNEAAVHKYGYSRSEFLSLTLFDIRPPEDHDSLLKNIASLTPAIATSGPWRHIKKSGEIIFVEIISHSINYMEKEARLVLSNDITQKKLAEDNLKILNESLEQKVIERTVELETANRAKSEFLANMSHEIRTPMNAILGYSELMELHVSDPTLKDYLNSIKSSGKTLLTLINDILDLSKIESGKLELEFDFVEASTFFSEFAKIFAFKTNEKGIRFLTDIRSDTPLFLYIDEIRMRQIIINLVANAVKFTGKGSVSLKVCCENKRVINYTDNSTEELSDLIIEVTDTGIGIPAEFQKEIFSSFVQVKTRMSKGGTGLGLAITLRLVQLMNGTIEVKSIPGKGSTFIVKIPDIKFLNRYDLNNGSINVKPANVVFEKATILVVDDVEHNRRYIRDALSRTEITVIEAENGSVALKSLGEILPDAVITDLRMPEMNGFELLREIKSNERFRHIPFIAYSASVMKDQKEKILREQFAGLLIKPVRISELYSELMKLLPYRVLPEFYDSNPPEKSDVAGNIFDASDLIHLLETDFNERWKSFALRQPIGEVRIFGNDLLELGLRHNSFLVTSYGDEIRNAAGSFNITAVLTLLNKYPEILGEIKKRSGLYF